MQLGYGHIAQDVFMEMTKVSAETLNVECVSIWRLSDDKEQLECLSLYLKSETYIPLQNRCRPKIYQTILAIWPIIV